MSLCSSPSWICVQVSGDNPGDSYSVYQCGSHADGTFIRVYVPEAAANPETKSTRPSSIYMDLPSVCPRFMRITWLTW